MATMYTVGFNLAVGCAFARVAGIVAGAARSLMQRRRFEVVRFGVVEAIWAVVAARRYIRRKVLCA